MPPKEPSVGFSQPQQNGVAEKWNCTFLVLEERCIYVGKQVRGILRFGQGLWANMQGCLGSKYMHYILGNGSTNGRNYHITLKMRLGYKVLKNIN